jgi:hypothetical protein
MERRNTVSTIWQQARPHLQRAGLYLRVGARRFARVAGPALREFWRLARPVLKRALEFLLALVIVFEEWGWRPLAELLGRFARWRPWALLETLIVRLPPYAALVVFALPTLLLLPLKFLALLLIGNGQVVLATLLFVAAKVIATALVARLFLLTQPALMQIGWFAYGYDTVMPWKQALTDRVHASWAWRVGRIWKERARRVGAAAWRRWRPTMLELRHALAVQARELRVVARRWVHDIRQRWTV